MTDIATPNGTAVAVRAQQNATAIAQSAGNLPTDFESQLRFAELVAKSDLVDKKLQNRPANVFMVMQKAISLNITFDLAVAKTHVIDNKVTPSAELLRILLRRAGHDIEFTEIGDKVAKATLTLAHRPDRPVSMEYTIAKAQSAGLTNKPVWKQYAESMLVAAVTRMLVRFHCPEIAAGLDLSDDLAGVEFGDTTPMRITSERVQDAEGTVEQGNDQQEDDQQAEQAMKVLAQAMDATSVTTLTRLGKEAREAGLLDVAVDEDGTRLQKRLMDRLSELETSTTVS